MSVMKAVIEKVKELEFMDGQKSRPCHNRVRLLAASHHDAVLNAHSVDEYKRHWGIFSKLRQWQKALK